MYAFILFQNTSRSFKVKCDQIMALLATRIKHILRSTCTHTAGLGIDGGEFSDDVFDDGLEALVRQEGWLGLWAAQHLGHETCTTHAM